jgi:hypothetical protein
LSVVLIILKIAGRPKVEAEEAAVVSPLRLSILEYYQTLAVAGISEGMVAVAAVAAVVAVEVREEKKVEDMNTVRKQIARILIELFLTSRIIFSAPASMSHCSR